MLQFPRRTALIQASAAAIKPLLLVDPQRFFRCRYSRVAPNKTTGDGSIPKLLTSSVALVETLSDWKVCFLECN